MMNNKNILGIHRVFLALVLLIPLAFAVPVAAATSQCTSTVTTQTPTNTFMRTFSYMVFGTVTGNWSSAFTAVVRGMTYTVTVNTQCAPRQ